MRTKALLCLAAIAAIAIPASAQVYSANIVGYVNVPVAGNGALSLVANPLKPSNGNYNITNTISLPDTWNNAALYKWAGTKWDSNIPTWFEGFGWFPDATVNLGEAVFIKAPPGVAATTITFVGEVQTGTVTNTVQPGLNFVASKIPVAAPFPGGATVGNNNDSIYLWEGSKWSSTIWTFFEGFGWFGSGAAGEVPEGPVLDVGKGVLYKNTGSAVTWQKTFNPS